MGSGLSPILADYFMDSIENKILNGENKITEKVGLWYRMVDITCLWEGNETELEKLLEMMNNVDENVKFKVEKEENKTLDFLDLSIEKHQADLKFKIYRKPTNTDVVINQSSYQLPIKKQHLLR